MKIILSGLAAILMLMPFIAYIIVFFAVKVTTKNHRKAVSYAINITTIFFILSVHNIAKVIWLHSFFWLIILFMLVIAVFFVFLYRYLRNEIVYGKIFKGYWRFNFLLFFLVYIILMLYGITQSIISSVAMN